MLGSEHERRPDESLASPHDEPHGTSGLRRGRGPGVPAQGIAVSVAALLDLFVQHGHGIVFTAILLGRWRHGAASLRDGMVARVADASGRP